MKSILMEMQERHIGLTHKHNEVTYLSRIRENDKKKRCCLRIVQFEPRYKTNSR